ncbi:hypothetical protein, partial [Enterococcus faecium]|uniref:hypothetical protein n=1 Tax=Enterococcus faecium TaxID=1352 RepID=UPI003F41E2CC
PAPGQTRPAVFEARIHDVIWETLYAPIGWIVEFVAGVLDRTQHLTIRRYLNLVFIALIFLLLVLATWR